MASRRAELDHAGSDRLDRRQRALLHDDRHGGRGCVLVHPDDAQQRLPTRVGAVTTSGTHSVWASGEGRGFEAGLAVTERDARLEFFVQARTPVGATTPVVDVSLPFLW